MTYEELTEMSIIEVVELKKRSGSHGT